MKTVLFATTALVALAGAASAQSISWGGSVTTGYNDVIEGGLFLQGDISASATVDLGDNVTAKFEWAGVSWDNTAASALSNKISATITYTNNSMTASLRAGDLNDKGASEYFYADRSGMAVDVENQDGSSDVRALLEFGNFGVAVGCGAVGGVIGACDGLNVGAGATFGSIDLGIGYDDASGTQSAVTAVSASATFGSMKVGVSYATGTTTYVAKTGVDAAPLDPLVGGTDTTSTGGENSIGVDISYEISSSLSVGAYYAANSFIGAAYGVSVDFSAGAFSASAYYDQGAGFVVTQAAGAVDVDGDGYYDLAGTAAAGATTPVYGVDLAYAVSDAITASAGVKIAATTVYYAGVEFAVNDNITATLSYATADAISGPEFKNGITAMISADF